MPFEALLLPAWSSFLVGLVLFFMRKWIADVAASIASLEARLRASEKAQAECRLELVKGYATRESMEQAEARLENQATRLVVLEERSLSGC